MPFATQLKLLRAKKRVTQQELADYLNVTRPTIAGYETKGKEPDYHTLLRLSSYFHVSTDYLLTGKEFPESIETDDAMRKKQPYDRDILVTRAGHDKLVSMIIEYTHSMEVQDLNRMIEYAKLLLNQPQYQKK